MTLAEALKRAKATSPHSHIHHDSWPVDSYAVPGPGNTVVMADSSKPVSAASIDAAQTPNFYVRMAARKKS